MGNDNTVKWQRLNLQLPPSRLRVHFVKATVRVHEYPDGQMAGRTGWPTTAQMAVSSSRRPAPFRRSRRAMRADGTAGSSGWKPASILVTLLRNAIPAHTRRESQSCQVRLWACGQRKGVAHMPTGAHHQRKLINSLSLQVAKGPANEPSRSSSRPGGGPAFFHPRTERPCRMTRFHRGIPCQVMPWHGTGTKRTDNELQNRTG